MFRKLREPVNGLTHLIAAVVAAVGLVVMLYFARQDSAKLISLSIYGLTLILMFSASGLYHSIQAGPKAALILRKLDHTAIYLLIAGTYTPISLHFFTGFWRLGMLIFIWSLAIIGIGVKLFVINIPRWITTGIYLLMGWSALFSVGQIMAAMPAGALAWLVTGGLFYTVGAVIYILKKPNIIPGVFGFHEIWHIFVILGAFSHFIIMAVYIALPAAV